MLSRTSRCLFYAPANLIPGAPPGVTGLWLCGDESGYGPAAVRLPELRGGMVLHLNLLVVNKHFH